MGFATFALFIVAGLVSSRSLVYLACGILGSGLLVLNNKDNADYAAYSAFYDAPRSSDLFNESGWRAISIVGSSLGLSYNQFAACVVMIATLIVVLFFRSVCYSTNFAFAIFALYPGLINFVQLRQFVAIAVSLLGYTILSSRKGSRLSRNLAFVAVIFVASQFHSTALIQLVVPIIIVALSSGPVLRSCFAVLMIGAYLYLLFFLDPQGVASSVFDSDKSEVYFQVSYRSTLNAIACSLLILLVAVLAVVLRRGARSSVSVPEAHDQEAAIFDVLVAGALASVLVIPLLFISIDFMRLSRFFWVVSIPLFVRVVDSEWRRSHLVSRCSCSLVAIWANYLLINLGSFESVTLPLLSF